MCACPFPAGLAACLPAVALAAALAAGTCLAADLAAPSPAPGRGGAGAAGPAARFDAWNVIGMGGGGTMICPAVSPHDPRIEVEACDMTGAYITLDGGNSYRMFNLRTGISTYAFDPGKPNVIYAANCGLWRSEDTGRTWSLVFPDPKKNTVEHMRGDHADYFLTSDDAAYPSGVEDLRITAIAVDPRNSKSICVAFNGGWRAKAAPSFFFSRDGGRTWTRALDLAGSEVNAIDIDPLSSKVTIFAADRTYAEKTPVLLTSPGKYDARRIIWQEHAAPKDVTFVRHAVGRAKDHRLVAYATARAFHVTAERESDSRLGGGIYVSTDGGMTWKDAADSIGRMIFRPATTRVAFQAISCAATNAEVAYVGFRGLALGEGPANLHNGIARTTDGGATWTIVKQESNAPSKNATLGWVEPRMRQGNGDIWFDSPRELAVAPTDGDVCYATDLFRTYRTTDGGKWWETITSAKVRDDWWTTRGLDVTTCYGVHFDPFNATNAYISYTDMGMFRSEDGGATWTSSIDGIPDEWRNTTYWLEFDPEVKGLVWGAFSGPHDLPRPKMWRNRDVGDYTGGVATSTDGGKTWTVTDAGINESAVTHVVLDPDSPAGRRTLYACGFGKGVFKSTDNGKTWTAKNDGIDGKQPFAWRITRARSGTLYLIVARRSESSGIGGPDDGALYRSTDGAEHWEKMTLPDGCNGPNGLALDPADEKRTYLAAWGKVNAGAGDSGGGIFVSEDAGKTWRSVLSSDQHLYDVTVDSRNGALYACGFESSAYRSTDRGETWTRIGGYNFKWGHRVVPDPTNPDMIYITTFGGSVWRGPAAGDPNAVEDILTPLSKRP